MLKITNAKLYDWIMLKDKEVAGGRKISEDMDKLEKKIKRFEIMEKRITGKIKPDQELVDKGDKMVKDLQKMQEELMKIADGINKKKLEAVPQKMKDEHMALLKEREVLERERNKVALKVQKIKDRIVPLVQKEVKPLLCAERIEQIDMGRFDDIETAKAKDGVVEISTFNRLTDFMNKFK